MELCGGCMTFLSVYGHVILVTLSGIHDCTWRAGRLYGVTKTKFFCADGLPDFIAHGTPCMCL